MLPSVLIKRFILYFGLVFQFNTHNSNIERERETYILFLSSANERIICQSVTYKTSVIDVFLYLSSKKWNDCFSILLLRAWAHFSSPNAKKEKKKKKRKTQRALTRSKFSKFFILDLFARRFDKSGLEGVGGPLLTDVAVAIEANVQYTFVHQTIDLWSCFT